MATWPTTQHTYMVCYDLKKGESYKALHDYLKSSGTYWHGLDSTWFVATNLSVSSLCNAIIKHVNSDDKILVLNPHNGIWASYNLGDRLNDWLKSRLAA